MTIEQISRQDITDKTAVEFIVVDNNSPDHTAAVIQQIEPSSSILMHNFFERRQGLSHARNTGVANAAGQYILYTDDDIPENWMSGYIRKIAELSPDCLYSKIDIIWDRKTPWWYTQRYRPYFVGLDYGDATLEVEDIHKEFFGKNFRIRKDLIVALGGFDPALGRSGTMLIAGEETQLYRNLIKQQKAGLYFPGSPAGHRLKACEYSEENITKQFIDSSYSAYRIAKLTARKKLFGRSLGVLKNSLNNIVVPSFSIPGFWLNRNKQELFFHIINLQRAYPPLRLWLRW